jgi:hypothetical protein
MLLPVTMLELVSWIMPRALGLNRLNAPAPTVERARPSVGTWRGLFTSRTSPDKRAKHLFAIQRLPRGAASHPYNYCYYCVRCRWNFLVDGRGGVVAVGEDNQPLDNAVAELREKSFACGPCGAHWASIAVVEGGRKERVQEPPSDARTAPLTLVRPRREAAQSAVR